MRPLSVHELLGVWERGLAVGRSERALAILAAACPESAPAELARVSIGRRDGRLLTVREWAFGPDLAVLADCPRCHQPLETMLRVGDLRAPEESAADGSMMSGRYVVRYRAPSTADLLACQGPEDTPTSRRLFASCVLEASRDGAPVSAGDLPDDIVGEAVERIAALDPQADTRIKFSCPDCDCGFSEVFDIVSFFWTEIDVWARRLLRDVNVLARAYGWREHDILTLSPMRRQLYLAMAQA